MATNEFPTYNGVAVSWADVNLRFSPTGAAVLETSDFKDISTSRKVEVGDVYGASGGAPMNRTTGQAKYEGTITLYRIGYQKLLRALKPVAPIRRNRRILTLVHFGVQVLHTPFNSVEIFDRRIKGARVISDELKSAEGIEADTVPVGLSIIDIVDMIDGEEVALL